MLLFTARMYDYHDIETVARFRIFSVLAFEISLDILGIGIDSIRWRYVSLPFLTLMLEDSYLQIICCRRPLISPAEALQSIMDMVCSELYWNGG